MNMLLMTMQVFVLHCIPHDAMLSAVYARAIPSVRLSVCPSVTRVDQSKTVEVPSFQLGTVTSAGWLVGGKSCLSSVACQCVCSRY